MSAGTAGSTLQEPQAKQRRLTEDVATPSGGKNEPLEMSGQASAETAAAGSEKREPVPQPRASEREGDEEYQAWLQKCAQQRALALREHGREGLLDAVFRAWDRDGNGHLEFEEILPHYMKCARFHNHTEPEVRTSFEQFLTSRGRSVQDGITLELFHEWLAKLSDDQVAAHYVRHVLGLTRRPYAMNVSHAVVKEYRHKSLREILDAPAHALWGISELGEDVLAPLGLRTVRDVGSWKCFLLARAICTLAGKEIPAAATGPEHLMNIRNALKDEYSTATLKELQKLPVSVLSIFPDKGDADLHWINVWTIGHLGTRQYFHAANALIELERFENEGRLT